MEKLALIVRYEANINYYSTVLCEKKGTPDDDCNGKCFLRKELKSLDNQKKIPANTSSEKQEIVQYLPVENNYNINPFVEAQLSDKVFANYVPLSAQEVSFIIFHPPCFS